LKEEDLSNRRVDSPGNLMNKGDTMHNRAENLPILVVDDDEVLLSIIRRILEKKMGAEVVTMTDPREVLPFLARQGAALVVLDLNMPRISGRELLRELRDRHPKVPVVISTAEAHVDTAVECMREGAIDYLVKPVAQSRLMAAVGRALEEHAFRNGAYSPCDRPAAGPPCREEVFADIITRSPEMHSLFRYVELVAPSSLVVLITGETGVGKELFSRAIHLASGRKGPFVAINVAGLDDQAFSDTLFGHRRGAFTGAEHAREGLISAAAGGTLFLDEVGDLSSVSQVKLLRLLQENEYYPLGSDTPSRSTTRIVVATNRDMESHVAQDRFRKDLYYRLAYHQIRIPPLRRRPDDIPLLLDHFVAMAADSLARKKPRYPAELLAFLTSYDFPGNVRELCCMVMDAVARSDSGRLSVRSFQELAQRGPMGAAPCPGMSSDAGNGVYFPRFPTLREANEELIQRALQLAGGNQGIAASLLGITRQALNIRLRRGGRS
jgi:DNA-binding NtrC family response regulator